jgi:hypothetical protein
MKLVDVEFEKENGVVNEAPKFVKIVFLFETKPGKVSRIPVWLVTKTNTHKAVILQLHSLINRIIDELEE